MSDVKNLKLGLESILTRSDKVMIFPHVGADFDAIASSLGVALIADKLKKPNHILMGDPIYKLDHGVQTIVSQLKDEHSIIGFDQYGKETHDTDLNILCDVNKPKLLHKEVHPEDFDQDRLVIIDHHEKDKETYQHAALEFIDPTLSSASEIVTNLLSCFKIKYSPRIANILLAGILLDTNRLSKNVSSETMKTVTKLLESGATMEDAGNYFIEDFNSDRKIQKLVSRTQFLNYTVGVILADDEEYTREELAKAADYLLRYKVDAAYAIGNIGDGVISISARSKDSVHVGNVMGEIEGGGTPCSAATKLYNTTVEETGERLKGIILPKFYIQKKAY